MDVGFAVQVFLNGLSLSSTYVLIAVGLTLVFGVLRIMNFAHGELLMVGGYVTLVLFAEWHLPFVMVVVVAMLVVGSLSLATERCLFRFTRAIPFNGFILSLGLAYVLQVSALILFGPLARSYPLVIPEQVEIRGAVFSLQRLVMFPIVSGIIAVVWVMLERSKFGRAVRACIQDRKAASLQGISIDRISVIVMFIAGILVGLAGAVACQGASVGPYIGVHFILKAFIIVIVGGMGSVGGTVVAGLIFGFLDSAVSSLISPRISILTNIAILFLVLIIRPKGLFGRE